MGISPYLLKFRSKLTGNMIESRDMADIRRGVVSDIRQVRAVIEAHDNEVSDINAAADNTMLLPNGYWTNGTPDGLRMQAMGLESHYDRLDYDSKQSLFERIYSADMEIAKSGVYEKQGQQILGRADLVTSEVADELDSAFGTEYDDYAVGRLQIEEQISMANEDVDAYLKGLAAQHHGHIPQYTPGVYVPVKPETTLDTLPQARQDRLRKVAREAVEKAAINRRRPNGYVSPGGSTGPDDQYQ